MKIFNKAIDFFILIFFIILQVVFGEQLKLYYINFDFILVVIVALTFKKRLDCRECCMVFLPVLFLIFFPVI